MAKSNKISKSYSSPQISKPTLTIDTKRLRGNSFKVGRRAKVVVTGTITGDNIDDYEVPGRRSFRLRVDKVSKMPSGKKKR